MCGKCIKQKIPPCVFCSEACLKLHWPRHKEWHKQLKQHLALKLSDSTPSVPKEVPQHLVEENAEYFKLIHEGLKLSEEKNYSKAKKKYKKAMELDPMNTSAYLGIASTYERSSQQDEALKYLEQGLQKASILALESSVVTSSGEPLFINGRIHRWIEIIKQLVFNHYFPPGDRHLITTSKPFWVTNDAALKCIVKAILDFSGNDDKLPIESNYFHTESKFYWFCASVLCGNLLELKPRPDRATKEDLLKAAAAFGKASTIRLEEGFNTEMSREFDIAQSLCIVAAMGDCKEEENFNEGCWVILMNLQRVKSLNHKVGLITASSQGNDGRLEVKVDNIDSVKRIKPENLVLLPIDNPVQAFASCLGNDEMWTFMRKFAQRILEEQTREVLRGATL